MFENMHNPTKQVDKPLLALPVKYTMLIALTHIFHFFALPIAVNLD